MQVDETEDETRGQKRYLKVCFFAVKINFLTYNYYGNLKNISRVPESNSINQKGFLEIKKIILVRLSWYLGTNFRIIFVFELF